MADFLNNLWSSVFTPGPTPTLLVATNATFAALQTTLFALLLYTYSIHFLILSILCAGLWVSINWFASELRVAQAQADQRRMQEGMDKDQIGLLSSAASSTSMGGKGSRTRREGSRGRYVSDTDGATGTETETEVEVEGLKTPRRSARVQRMRSKTPLEEKTPVSATGAGAGTVGSDVRRRMEGSGYISTDSEWEKIESER